MTCEPWPIVWPCDVEDEGSPEQRDAAESAARSILWARTGRRLGLCSTQEAYMGAGGAETCGRPYMTDDRVWHNGGHPGGLSCAIWLDQAPVYDVLSISIDAVEQDPSTYRVFGSRVERIDSCWPTRTPTSITYRFGVPLWAAVEEDLLAIPPVVAVPASPLWGLAAAAMGEVAYEILKGMCGGECRLPTNAVSVTRMGVTITRPDAVTQADTMLLGLEIADQLILAVNPHRKQQRSRVYSPDMPQRI